MRRTQNSRPHPRDAPWLALITAGYLLWSLTPLLLVVIYSFNAGTSVTRWEGSSLSMVDRRSCRRGVDRIRPGDQGQASSTAWR